jgi:hypothetical protein
VVCEYTNLCPLVAAKTNPYRCVDGQWSFDAKFEPIACPAQPHDGQACGCAMYLPSRCTYATSCGNVDAVCDGATQRWTVSSCATADAGTDAALDAAPAADASADDASVGDADPASDPSDADPASEVSADGG